MYREQTVGGHDFWTAQERTYHKHPIAVDGRLSLYGLSYLLRKNELFYWLDSARPQLITGQDEQRAALVDFVKNSAPGSIATVRGPFGSGKTALAYSTVAELVRSGAVSPGAIHRITQHDITQHEGFNPDDALAPKTVFDQTKKEGSTFPRVVFLEEIERTSDPETNEASFRNVATMRDGMFAPVIVLTGENTLDDPRFFDLVGSNPDEVLQIEMPPFTEADLYDAIKRRLLYTFGDVAKDIDVNNIFDPEIINVLIPNTDPRTATPRDIFFFFEALSSYTEGLKYTAKPLLDKPVHIDFATFRRAMRQQLGFNRARIDRDKDASQLRQEWFWTFIRDNYDPEVPFKSFTLRELLKIMKDSGFALETPEDTEDDWRFLYALRAELDLMEVNNSKLSPKPLPDTEFLPSTEAFIKSAIFAPVETK